MEPSRRVECRMCRGLNDPRNEFCERCGESLRAQGYRETGGSTLAKTLSRNLKRAFFLVVIVVVLGGLYYVVDRHLLPAIKSDPHEVAVATTESLPAPTTSTTIVRAERLILGESRYATSLAVSKAAFPSGATAVVLTDGEKKYAEAICAVPLAAAHGGPLLLLPSTGVDEALAAELVRLQPSTVFLVAVDKASRTKSRLKELLGSPSVQDMTGKTIYDTAVAIAEEIKSKTGVVEQVVLVPSDSFQEGIAVAPVAAVNGWPILLKPKEGDIPKVTARALKELAPEAVLVVGTDATLDVPEVKTLSGVDGYETCALVAAYSVERGLSFAHTALVTGEDHPDGLSAGPYLAHKKGVLLLVKPVALPEPIRTLYDAHLREMRQVDYIGLPDLANEMAGIGRH